MPHSDSEQVTNLFIEEDVTVNIQGVVSHASLLKCFSMMHLSFSSLITSQVGDDFRLTYLKDNEIGPSERSLFLKN